MVKDGILVEGGCAVPSPVLKSLIAVVCDKVEGKVVVTVLKQYTGKDIRCKNTRIVVAEPVVILDHIGIGLIASDPDIHRVGVSALNIHNEVAVKSVEVCRIYGSFSERYLPVVFGDIPSLLQTLSL